METATVNTQPIPQVKDLPHGDLLNAMYFIWDAFSRAVGLDFFPVKQTAYWMTHSDELRGDHLDIGLRIGQWNSEDKDLLLIYLNDENLNLQDVNENTKKLVYKDIPIYFHFYEDSDNLKNLTMFTYEHESWKLPNQFETWMKEHE